MRSTKASANKERDTDANARLFTVSDLVRIGVMAALIAVCSWITIPATIPFTMQTFAVYFALEFIGGRNGAVAYFLYALIGAVGVPVFSSFRGGLGHLVGPTGGYLVGFVFTGFIFWAFEKRFTCKNVCHYIVLAAGLAACYFFGTVWFMFQTGNDAASALMLCVVPYILPDVAKIALAVLLAVRLKKIIKI